MQQYLANSNAGRIEDNITLLRGALKEFPHQLSFMTNLDHALFFSGKEEYLDECIALCEKILGCPEDLRLAEPE